MASKIAGIDVHKKVLMVVVIDARTPDSKPERRRFTTMPSDLRRLSTWLEQLGVEEAVMESTAQYWRSVWLELEPHFRLHLAQAFSNRAPRGRKQDFKDAERLVRRLIAQELILSFGFFRTFGEVGAGHCVCSNWRSFRLHARRVCAADRISRVRTWSV